MMHDSTDYYLDICEELRYNVSTDELKSFVRRCLNILDTQGVDALTDADVDKLNELYRDFC